MTYEQKRRIVETGSVRFASHAPEKKELAERFRDEMTPQEASLWSFLRGNRLAGLRFRRQQIIAGFIVDFYCHAAALAIELDGSVHDQTEEYDHERTRILGERGIMVMRFSNSRVEEEIHPILAEIIDTARTRVESLKSSNPM